MHASAGNSPLDMSATLADLPDRAAALHGRLAERTPRVHCITNTVAQAFTANVLLAVGAIPSMTIAPQEIGGFVAGADAVLINLGTIDSSRREAMEIAVTAANDHGLPWVLDPAFIERSRSRASFARELLDKRPRALRLNRAEFETLAGSAPSEVLAAEVARRHHGVVALTGAVDLIADGTHLAHIANGHPLMSRVTAVGCATSALVAAGLAVEIDAFTATAAALLICGVAGEIAAARARGPGSFAVELIDALAALDRAALTAHAKVS